MAGQRVRLVDNGLKYKQDVNWGEVAKLSLFRGTTGSFLAYEYHNTLTKTKQYHRDMSYTDFTSDLVLNWHENKKYYVNT